MKTREHYQPADSRISVVHESNLPDSVTPAVLAVRYQRDDHSPAFFFHVRSNRIVVSTQPKGEPWSEKLTEQEQTDIFQFILAEFRQRSEGDNRWKGAAIGITGGDKPQIFIGMNTKRQDPFHKDCAESNVINNVEILDNLEEDQGKSTPFTAKLTRMYVMGGREAKSGDKGSPINCPCGKCTDILRSHMPKGSEIMVLPIPSKEGEPLKKLKIVSSSSPEFEEFGNVEKTVIDGQPIAWKTTIDHLDKHHFITLDKDTVAAQRDAVKGLAGHISILPQERAEKALGFSLKEFQSREGKAKTFLAQILDPVAEIPREISKALKAAENILFARNSIAEIDVDAGGDEAKTLASVNRYMVQQIESTLANRVEAKGLNAAKIGTGEAADAKGNKVACARCVVIRLSDGTFHSGVEIDSDFDKATPNAEMNALTHAIPNLVRANVEQVWVMEFDPKDIEHKVMETSSKEGLERILKRTTSPEALKVTFIPFNGGEEKDLARVQGSIKPFGINQIFPSNFAGNQGVSGASGR
jgi:hypothetical protein